MLHNVADQRDRALLHRIKHMTYEEMVRQLRFAPVGDPLFEGEPGLAFARRLRHFEDTLPPKHKLAISQEVGCRSPR
jgi:hypothetical protein